jgi:hypothetical protein
MFLKILILVIFFAIMIGVGVYYRKSTKDVQGFVLGDRKVGSWLTAFAFGTSYFSAVIFVGYAGQFRLEIRYVGHMDRNRKRLDRFTACMEDLGSSHTSDDTVYA